MRLTARAYLTVVNGPKIVIHAYDSFPSLLPNINQGHPSSLNQIETHVHPILEKWSITFLVVSKPNANHLSYLHSKVDPLVA